MALAIPFVKAAACGNDFVILESAHAAGDLADLTRRICDRHDGVGADGAEWLGPAADADVHARLLNADGSEAEISGNGTRCVAAHWVREHGGGQVVVRTGAGVKTCTLMSQSGASYEFETAMGQPQKGEPLTIALSAAKVTGVPVSLGNPHFVIFVDEFRAGWQEQAAEIGRHAAFPQGVNVELVHALGPHHVEVRIFERGVGETRSSGTGALATAVAAIGTGHAESPVVVPCEPAT